MLGRFNTVFVSSHLSICHPFQLNAMLESSRIKEKCCVLKRDSDASSASLTWSLLVSAAGSLLPNSFASLAWLLFELEAAVDGRCGILVAFELRHKTFFF